MASTVIMQAQQLAIGYGTKTIGSSIDFSLRAGQTLCVLGPNGSGKSTLFKTLLGLQPALAGQIHILGRPLARWSKRELAQHIAYVPQQTQSIFAFAVLDIVMMGRSAYIGLFASPSAKDRDLALQCLARLGIEHLAWRSFLQLSGGEQQLVLLARALVQEPQALILDEPTASLDFGNQIRVLEQIQVLREQGLAIFLCTHQPEHAYRVADQVLLLKKGQVMAAGDTANTLTLTTLAQLYDLPIAAVSQHAQNVIPNA